MRWGSGLLDTDLPAGGRAKMLVVGNVPDELYLQKGPLRGPILYVTVARRNDSERVPSILMMVFERQPRTIIRGSMR